MLIKINSKTHKLKKGLPPKCFVTRQMILLSLLPKAVHSIRLFKNLAVLAAPSGELEGRGGQIIIVHEQQRRHLPTDKVERSKELHVK